MCYLLYGNVNSEAYDDLFLEISHRYGFANGNGISKKDTSFNSDIKDGVFFYVTGGYCDCNTSRCEVSGEHGAGNIL